MRGGLVDVFPTTGREPLRIELFGDEIEQIRAFSPFTQRALRQIDEATIYPGGERGASWSRSISASTTTRSRRRRRRRTTSCRRSTVRPISSGSRTRCARLWDEEGLAPVDLEGSDDARRRSRRASRSRFDAQRPALAARGLSEAENELSGLLRQGLDVVVAFPHRGEAQRQQQLLRRVEAPTARARAQAPEGLTFAVAPARRGFVWRELGFALLPDTQVFRRAPPRATAPAGRALAELLRPAHRRLRRRTRTTASRSCSASRRRRSPASRATTSCSRFRGDDRVYVPHEQIGKVSRYIGADSKAPTLSKLGGKAWDNLKTRAREHLREMAGELLAALRAAADAARHRLRRRPRMGRAARGASSRTARPRTSAPRSRRCMEDLEAPHPMDRLVCGDVGFGKTEVALRAAFAVAVNGKQVLMLVPTTVLAQQHWNTFRDRYRDFPVRVEMVSRFRKPADVKKVLAEFAEGKVDVLIGTHRVLSRDVIPKELGLVIVDEEQRFGVAQKELLRQLRLEVDVLALSATPIPRTLHMSLAGLRDISVIETPPEGRRPIRTFVGEFDDELIKQRARARDRARGAGVLPPQPRRDDRGGRREAAAARARPRASSSRTARWRERELEDTMITFLAGDADVLVSTTIIESGLDIPQANTLIVERADPLGLASSTRSAAASAAATRSRTPTSSIPTRTS